MRIHRVAALVAGFGLIVGIAHADPSLEAGSDYYRVAINGADRMLYHGNPALFAGPLHPATLAVGRPAEMSALRRTCLDCGGYEEASHVTVRSYSGLVDYRLGSNSDSLLGADPGFECVEATDLGEPEIEFVDVGGEHRGVTATWRVVQGAEAWEFEQRLVVQGTDFISSAVELMITVRNLGTAQGRIGLRTPLYLRLSTPDVTGNPAGGLYLEPRLQGAVSEPRREVEFAMTGSSLDAWQIDPNGWRYPNPYWPYHLGGRVQPTPALTPAQVMPELMMVTASNHPGSTAPRQQGVLDHCFSAGILDPPRQKV